MTFFTPIINSFIDLRVSMGYNGITYQYLRDFDKFVFERCPGAMELDESLVLAWSKKRDNEKHTGHGARISKLRLLAKYMIAMGYHAYVLPEKYSSRKTDFVPYIFTNAELALLFDVADKLKPCKRSPFRLEELPIMLRLAYCCGLRPGECRCLKSYDVDLNKGVLLVRENKQHKERFVPMSSSVTEMCSRYTEKLQQYMPHSEFFFPDPSGASYSSSWLKHSFKMLWLTAYPESSAAVRAYDLRHQFATTVLMKWLNEGADINARLPYLSAYMGHANFEDTAYYIHLLPDNLIRSSAIDWNHFNSLIPEVPQ